MLKNFFPSIKKFRNIRAGDILVDPVENSKVMLIGNFGNGNLGDEILLFCTSQDLKKNGHSVVVAVRDSKLLTKENQDVLSVKPASFAGIKAILFSNHIIIGPGGIFGGDIGPYASLLPFLVVFLKVLRKRAYYYGIGVYDNTPLYIQLIVKLSCYFVDYVSVRDEHSYKLLAGGRIKVKKTVLILDPAFYIFDYIKKPKMRKGKDKKIGISLRYIENYKERTYLKKVLLDAFSKQRSKNYLLSLDFYTQPTSLRIKHLHPWDKSMFDELILSMGSDGVFRVIPGNALSIKDILETYSSLDRVIAVRFHAQIMAMIFNLPLFSLGYSPKNEFSKLYRKATYSTIDALRNETITNFLN